MSATVFHRLAAQPGTRTLLDVTITAVALVLTLSQLSHGGLAPGRHAPPELDTVEVLLGVCATVPLLAWRRFPLGVFVVTALASVLLAALGYPLDLVVGASVALYLLAASRGPDNPWTVRDTVTVAGLFAAYLGASAAAQGSLPGTELLHTGLAGAGAWFAGDHTRLRGEQLGELRERALRAERDAERERLLAVAEERARIARDLHDSAGHAISVIAVRAGAARLRHDREPERCPPALTAIEELARQTVDEIDHLVGTLRDGGTPNGPGTIPPGLASLDTLVAHHAASGLGVTYQSSGEPRPLSPAADQAAYRILQEALTNAARHGSGPARIALAYGTERLDLTVTNPADTTGTPRPGGGHGLIGMRERATRSGGSLDTERVDGMFRVRARLPYGGHRP